MAKYTIRQVVEYYGEGIEADSKDEALALFIGNDDYYWGVIEETVTEDDDEGEE